MMSGFPNAAFLTSVAWFQRDSRECPGPSTEAELSRPSTRRVLTAGALALAVIAPSVESAERSAEAASPPPNRIQVVTPTPAFDPLSILGREPERATRSIVRRPSVARPAAVRPAARVIRKAVRPEPIKIAAVLQEAHARPPVRVQRRVHIRRTESVQRRVVKHRVVKHRRPVAERRTAGARRGMTGVISFARAQVGKRYVRGADGPNSFDCSGFTKRAYARAGLRLPHSSGAQAARARTVSRAKARPGDLVVGPGHVGIYMGRGMMIDAGNSGTGVVYRRLYSGLHIERF